MSSNNKDEKKFNPHANHRDRLKKRFLSEGLDNFEYHNALELLLFYSIPQKDTNELAHLLINKFGSFAEVFNAPFEEIIKVPGISTHSATLIKLIPELARKYMTDDQVKKRRFESVDDLGKYFLNKFVGEKNDTVYLLLLNNNHSEIDCIKIHRGSVNSAAITTRTLAEAALFKRASMAVLAHNHPNGLALPSPDDIHTTNEVKKALGTIDVELIAHIIVGQGAYTDVMTFLTNT